MTSYDYVFDFSRAGNISGGVEQGMPFDDMPAIAEYYVNDSNLAIPFGTRLSPLIADWIDIAVASYFADRFAIRRTKADSRQEYHWGRAIKLRIGVRQPDTWRRPELLKSLSSLLGFMTGDKWEFEFSEYQGKRRFSEVNGQANLFPLEGPTLVALYSGGLDSFAGVTQYMSAKDEHQFVLVSGVTNSRQQAGQRRQGARNRRSGGSITDTCNRAASPILEGSATTRRMVTAGAWLSFFDSRQRDFSGSPKSRVVCF